MISLLALLSTSWLGARLTEPYADVFARKGDPVVATHDATLTKYVYLTGDENAFVTIVTEQGRVSAIRLWALPTATPKTADPFGIALNESSEVLLQKRGAPSRIASDSDGPFDAYQDGEILWLYHINGNKTVSTITLSTTEAAIDNLPSQPLPALHDGSSQVQAIRMDVASANDARRWESMFLAVHPCSGGGKLHQDTSSTQTDGARSYDVVSASCSTNGAKATLYFTRV
jgi:hypothetical protein